MIKGLDKAIREVVEVPAYIDVASNMCRYDLMYGPAYARLPQGDVTKITDDDLSTLYRDAEESCEEGDCVVEVYTSEVGDALRTYIDDLPSTLYYDDDCGCVMTREPEGEEFDTGEVDDDGEPIMQWCEPTPYYVLGSRDIVEALFGRTIAREFR